MGIDLAIVLVYFVFVFTLGIIKRAPETSAKEYFLKSNTLRWPAIAFSTIATNIHAGHFIGMAGSAYLYGIAQGGFEINAIQGILIAAFVFVPLFLKSKVTTISQYFAEKLGAKVALTYSLFMILLYGFLYLGSTLFWGAYAINALFEEAVSFIHPDPMSRILILSVGLGVFSATYTILGGMGAVVRTDIAQFALMVGGGIIMLYLSLKAVGGWDMLQANVPEKMHLHLPADHPTLPWPAVFGMMLLNLNYWGCNQIILQRALAAKDVRHAQIGLIVGGFLKYLMAALIVIPGVALAVLLANDPLTDPDLTYPTLVNMLLPAGMRGIILCGLFASLMSSVDSIFHSVSTLWTVDVYQKYIRPQASDRQLVSMGRKAIGGALVTGSLFAFVNVYVKFENPEFALTHWFNEVSYYVKNGFVLLILCAAFLVGPSRKLVLGTLIGTVILTIISKIALPDLNYLNRAALVIILSTAVVAVPTIMKNGWPMKPKDLLHVSTRNVGWFGLTLAGSLVACHIWLH